MRSRVGWASRSDWGGPIRAFLVICPPVMAALAFWGIPVAFVAAAI